MIMQGGDTPFIIFTFY